MNQACESTIDLLNYSIANNDMETVEDMHSQGISFNQKDSRGIYPVNMAVSSHNLEALIFIMGLDYIDLNVKNGPLKNTPVLEAIMTRDIDIFRILANDERVDLTLKDSINQHPLLECIIENGLKEYYFELLELIPEDILKGREETAEQEQVIGLLECIDNIQSSALSRLIHHGRFSYINKTRKYFKLTDDYLETLSPRKSDNKNETLISA